MSATTAQPHSGRSVPTPAEAAHAATSNRTVQPEKCTGARSVIRSLEELGADTVFGLPGGAILPIYDKLYDSEFINHIQVRHEQGAGHAAEGYARSTGRVGVAMVTSGPAATNLVTALTDAQMDSIPMVAITGQVGESFIGTDAFQEADISGITYPVTKHSYMVTDPDTIPQVLAEAFHLAQTGRPGPVLVDITKSAMNAETTFSWPPSMDLPGYRPVTKPHGKQVREAARHIAIAEKPVFFIGGGIINANASKELMELVEMTGIPVVSSSMGLDAFPNNHELNYGMAGMHGTVPAVAALQKTDLIIALGTRFDDRVTGNLDYFSPNSQIIHADIDPAEIGKNV
ncbi:MAG: thiamine pyrophosphate-binding protein, partial [Lawsonella sp.]